MTNELVKPPIWFWVVVIVALIWNLMGVGVYLAEVFVTAEMLATMTEKQRELLENRPVWATAAFAIAVWFGFLGSFLLMLRRQLAYIVLIISLIGVIIQMIYNFFIVTDTITYGLGQIIMTLLILAIAIALVFLAKKGKTVNWLR